MNNLLYENASVLIIGNEILSGRTIDKNFNYIATKLGATDCIDPKSLPEGTNIQSHIVKLTKWGVDYTFSEKSIRMV